MGEAELETMEAGAAPASPPPGRERRRRPRSKVSAPIRVRLLDPGKGHAAEVATTVDASPDGFYFLAARDDYRKGLELAITFPYSGESVHPSLEQRAEVVRVVELPDGRFGIAVHILPGRRAPAEAGAAHPAATPTRHAAKDRPPGSAAVVLVVESESRTRNMMRAVLEGDGYHVEALASTSEAVEYLRRQSPAVLITEIESEEMSGYDLCLILKSSERLQHIPVIMTTRNGKPNDYSTAHALGATVCMAKPFKTERLLHVVHLFEAPVKATRAGAAAPARAGG